ncbi:ceramide synthase 6 isoform X2 [Strongylocentrotus purpuratus]|uniref:Ceramide synthase 6 n=1 Tax=Strongylocentrotus purpuratus TaxID=7668 RepID=A0A7M7NSF0_STRPU|nr:ceramide synthase 6 isoform X2 [Strongylocentrotus purpuratus]
MAAETSWIWSEWFWLPSNVSWSDLKNTDKAVYPRINDLSVIFPLAVALLLIRTAFERCIATPLGLLAGIKSKNHYDATPSTILEKVYKTVSKCPDRKRLEGLAKQLDWSVRTIERWFRWRRNQDRPSMLVKFTETSWRSVFYIASFSYGMYIVPTQPWFWDLRLCWQHFPFHPVTTEIYNYYMIEMSFYLSLILSLFTDVRRKDFVQQLIHHFTTIFLMGFSWTCNFTRVGCIVLVTHDVADIFLEFAKICVYVARHSAADALFGVFSIVFFVSRILFFPCGIIYSAIFHSLEIIGPFPAYYLFNGLLIILQILNSFWFFLIACMVYRALAHGQVTKDARSDVEESGSESEEMEETNGKMNHNHNYTNHINSNSNYKAVANHH